MGDDEIEKKLKMMTKTCVDDKKKWWIAIMKQIMMNALIQRSLRNWRSATQMTPRCRLRWGRRDHDYDEDDDDDEEEEEENDDDDDGGQSTSGGGGGGGEWICWSVFLYVTKVLNIGRRISWSQNTLFLKL